MGDIKNANKTKIKTFQWICSVLDMCWVSGNVCIVRNGGNISGQSLCHLRALGYWVTAQVTEKTAFLLIFIAPPPVSGFLVECGHHRRFANKPPFSGSRHGPCDGYGKRVVLFSGRKHINDPKIRRRHRCFLHLET